MQLAGTLGEFRDKIAIMRQKCGLIVEDVLSQHDGPGVHFDSAPAQLPSVHSSLTVVLVPLEQHLVRSTASHLQFESFLSSSVSWICHGVAWLVKVKFAAHRTRLTCVVSSTSDSLK